LASTLVATFATAEPSISAHTIILYEAGLSRVDVDLHSSEKPAVLGAPP